MSSAMYAELRYGHFLSISHHLCLVNVYFLYFFSTFYFLAGAIKVKG